MRNNAALTKLDHIAVDGHSQQRQNNPTLVLYETDDELSSSAAAAPNAAPVPIPDATFFTCTLY